jgi:hypothetical protein
MGAWSPYLFATSESKISSTLTLDETSSILLQTVRLFYFLSRPLRGTPIEGLYQVFNTFILVNYTSFVYLPILY